MSEEPNSSEGEELRRAVEVRKARSDFWKREGERDLWQNLSMIGALGWLIVTPILVGIFVGRWLDKTFDSGIFYSGAMIFCGVVMGCYLAWQRINKD